VLASDVTELKRAENCRKLSLSVEQAADLVVITNREGKVEFANKAVEEVTGYTRDEFLAGGMDLIQAEKIDRRDHAAMWEILLSGQPIQAEVMYTRKNGEFIYLDEIATPIKNSDGSVTHVVFTGRDLTPVKLMRDKVDFLSSYDALTGLPNRTHFDSRLTRDSRKGGRMAVLAIDIDHQVHNDLRPRSGQQGPAAGGGKPVRFGQQGGHGLPPRQRRVRHDAP
jgi:PAS domain S-box-containing protein